MNASADYYNKILAQQADQFNQELGQNQANWEQQYGGLVGQAQQQQSDFVKGIFQSKQGGYMALGEGRNQWFPTGTTGQYSEPKGYIPSPDNPNYMIQSTEDYSYPQNKYYATLFNANQTFMNEVKGATTEEELTAAINKYNGVYSAATETFNVDKERYWNAKPMSTTHQPPGTPRGTSDPTVASYPIRGTYDPSIALVPQPVPNWYGGTGEPSGMGAFDPGSGSSIYGNDPTWG
jgi:hypothetical protein